MYLLEYDSQGVLDKITPDAPYGLNGAYVNKLPISIEDMLEQGTIEQVTEQDKIYYKIIGGNE
jgi:hypothetical protein